MKLENQIEAILFWKGEPMKIKKIAEILSTEEAQVSEALSQLESNLTNRGLVILRKDDEIALGTSPSISPLIEKLTKEELIRDLGKAGLETLAIIIYRGPVSRAEIDYIRGVQSNFIIRNLSIRGLIEKVSNPKDARSFLYKPTFELMQYLGVSKIEEMPEFESVKSELQKIEENKNKDTNSENVDNNEAVQEIPTDETTHQVQAQTNE